MGYHSPVFKKSSPRGASADQSFLVCSTQIRCLNGRTDLPRSACRFHLSDTRRPKISLTTLQPSEPVPRRAVIVCSGSRRPARAAARRERKIGGPPWAAAPAGKRSPSFTKTHPRGGDGTAPLGCCVKDSIVPGQAWDRGPSPDPLCRRISCMETG